MRAGQAGCLCRLGLPVVLVVACVAATWATLAPTAGAHRLSAAHKRAVTRELRRALRRSHGRALGRRWFIRKASLVDFTLPLTLRLSPAARSNGTRSVAAQTALSAAPAGATLAVQSTIGFQAGQPVFVFAPGQDEDSETVASVPDPSHLVLNAPLVGGHQSGDVVSSIAGGVNQATLDLGPALGVRSIGLGGYLPAQVGFRDALSGGQLGDVDLSIPPVSQVPSAVTTTSVPLLANPNSSTLTAPEDSLDAFVVSDADPGSVSLFFQGHGGSDSGPVSVGSIISSRGSSLQSALEGVTNPLTGSGSVGAGGVVAYAAPFATSATSALYPGLAGNCPAGPSAQCTLVLVQFTGPSFHAAALPALAACTTGNGCAANDDTAAYVGGSAAPRQLVTGQPAQVDGSGSQGCGSLHGNGSGSDPDLLANLSSSIDTTTGRGSNVGPGPAYGGSASPTDTTLRMAPLMAGVAPSAMVSIPTENQGAGVHPGTGVQPYALGHSGGRGNLFGMAVDGLPAEDSLDLTVNLQATINDVTRQIDGSFPSPPGVAAQTAPAGDGYANCRQYLTGAIRGYLTDLHLVGSLKINPGLTADGHLRLAKVYLHSAQVSRQSLAACLSPYQLYAQGNPFSDDPPFAAIGAGAPLGPNLLNGSSVDFSPLVPLLGSYLGAGSAFAGPAAASGAPSVGCDSGGGPLDRQPFAVAPLHGAGATSPTSDADLATSLGDQSAVVVSGSLNVVNLQAEALVGSVVGG